MADFGIALAVKEAGGNRLTETGLSLGTPQYMSPEQATGDRQLDARTDVYSLGAVLYEMLAGEPPHTGATAAGGDRQADDRAADPAPGGTGHRAGGGRRTRWPGPSPRSRLIASPRPVSSPACSICPPLVAHRRRQVSTAVDHLDARGRRRSRARSGRLARVSAADGRCSARSRLSSNSLPPTATHGAPRSHRMAPGSPTSRVTATSASAVPTAWWCATSAARDQLPS